jgi:hypothetical protein
VSCRAKSPKTPCPSGCPAAEAEPFAACLPFGARLRYDGRSLAYDPPADPPEDGAWLVEVEGGCVVGVVEPPLPGMVLPPTSTPPAPCGDAGSGGEAAVSPDPASLLGRDASGALVVRLHAEGAGDATVSGNGTTVSPLRVEVTAPTAVLSARTDTSAALSVGGAGTPASPLVVNHMPSAFSGQAGAMTVDPHGHVTAWSGPDGAATGVLAVTGAPGQIDVLTVGGAAGLSLPTLHPTPAPSFDTVDRTVTLDMQGRVASVVPKAADVVSWRFSAVLQPGWSSTSRDFVTVYFGRLRARLRGDLGSASAGVGLVAAPAWVSVSLDGAALPSVYAEVSGGRVVGLEILSDYGLEPGAHVLAAAFSQSVAAVSFLDLELCQ